MKDFKDYINEQEEKDYTIVNEDLTMVAVAVLGLPTAAALVAFGGSLLIRGYAKFLSSIINKIIRTWALLIKDVKSIGQKEVNRSLLDAKMNPHVKKYLNEEDDNRKMYADKLKKVYGAIEKKDFALAKSELNKVDKNVSNNADVHRVLITEISRVLKEPPLYVVSPGNKSYQAVKKVLSIRTARAAAEASKVAIEKSLKK